MSKTYWPSEDPVLKSIRRHQQNVLRRARYFNAGPRRQRLRQQRIDLGLHPDWGLIGPFQGGEHRNWARKRKRDGIRAERTRARAQETETGVGAA